LPYLPARLKYCATNRRFSGAINGARAFLPAEQINRAEGSKRAKILQAEGDAQAVTTVADATARALATVGAALQQFGAQDAMKMQVAQDFIAQWGGIAKTSNVMIVPADMGDLSKVVGTAFRIMDGVKPKNT